jgi:hypothetical protein
VGLALLLLLAGAALLRWATGGAPLAEAWQAVQSRAGYTFAGSTVRTLEGQTTRQLVRGRGEAGGRLVLDDGRGGTIEVAWPAVRSSAGAPLEPRALAALVPLGDPLAYLAVAHGAAAAGLEPVGERSCRRVDFLVGGRAYQAWWQRHPAYLPFNGDAGGMTTFSAQGAAWLDPATDLPCRIRLRADLPRTPGEGRGTAEVDWEYEWE